VTDEIAEIATDVAEAPLRVMHSCQRHGLVPWQGHLACGDCKRVFQTKHPDRPHYIPVKHKLDPAGDGATYVSTFTCKCGATLMPPMNLDTHEVIPEAAVPLAKKKSYVAARICFICFRQAVRQGGGLLLKD